jgi:hypothetical protein
MNYVKTHFSNPIGDINRKKIYEYILDNPGKGISEIQSNIKINVIGKDKLQNPSRQSLTTNLKILQNDGKILKHKNRYYARNEDDVAISRLSKVLKEPLSFMFSPRLIDASSDKDYKSKSLWISTPDLIYQNVRILENFQNNVKGLTISPKILKDELNKVNNKKYSEEKSNERYLLEFSIRLGAYITYIFINTMKLRIFNDSTDNKNNTKILISKDKSNTKRKNDLSEYFMEKAIDLKLLFHIFHALLCETRQVKNDYESRYDPNNTNSIFFDISNKEYNLIKETFRNVFPNFYEALKNYQGERIKEVSKNIHILKAFGKTELMDHKHNWIKMDLIDGNYYICMKCNLIVSEKIKTNLENENINH